MKVKHPTFLLAFIMALAMILISIFADAPVITLFGTIFSGMMLFINIFQGIYDLLVLLVYKKSPISGPLE